MTEHQSLTADQSFERGVYRIGRITILTCILLALSVPVVVVWWLLGIVPPLSR